MPIDFTCPQCGARTNVSDEYAGQTGPCAKCGGMITIPLPPGRPFAPAPPRPKRHVGLLIFVILLAVSVPVMGILLALLLPAVQAARAAARRVACVNNMKQLGVAMHNFNDAHGHLPAMRDPDSPEQPPCSWRVQLMPFLEHDPRFEQYDADQDWDSPTNQRLADPMPSFYRCPCNPTDGSLDTDYLTIVGPNAAFRETGSTRFSDISDGISNTMIMAESHHSGIHWMEPRDLKAEDVAFGINSSAEGSIQSEHPGVANVLFADGHVQSMSEDIDPEVLKAMSTINGGEPVSPFLR